MSNMNKAAKENAFSKKLALVFGWGHFMILTLLTMLALITCMGPKNVDCFSLHNVQVYKLAKDTHEDVQEVFH